METMRTSLFAWAVLWAALFLSTACTDAPPPSQENTDAKLLEAIESYLQDAKGIEVERMDVRLSDISVTGDSAACSAAIRMM